MWEAQGALFCLLGLSHMTLDNEGFLSTSTSGSVEGTWW